MSRLKRVTTIAIDGKPLDAHAISGPGMGEPTVREITVDDLADKEFLSKILTLEEYLSIVIEGPKPES